MSFSEFKKNYFQLFDQAPVVDLDVKQLGEQFRQLQQQLHPDRYAGKSAQEQRLAVQYSALVNQAYSTLRHPLSRSLYLLELEGMSPQEIASQKVDGAFLMEQMELREKLESIGSMVDPETVLDHLITEINRDISNHQVEFSTAYEAADLEAAAAACVKMQYLEKFLQQAEAIESGWLD
jgi:molecular chaperone HscB